MSTVQYIPLNTFFKLLLPIPYFLFSSLYFILLAYNSHSSLYTSFTYSIFHILHSIFHLIIPYFPFSLLYLIFLSHISQSSLFTLHLLIPYFPFFHRKNEPLQEAIRRKRAADSERDSFNQMTLYLEAIVYFLLTADAMERCNMDATWTMYKDTLALIK